MAITNAKMLQLLAPHLTKQFNDRIPDIEKANLSQLSDMITSYPTIANEFVETLTDQVVGQLFMSRAIDNPLSMFEKGSMPFGKTKELVYVDLIKGKDFTDRFGGSYEAEALRPEEVTNVKVQYISLNSRMKYKQTISNEMLATAFRDETGLSTLANQLASRLVDSYNHDKFLMTWKLIDTMPTTKASCVKPVDRDSAKTFARKVKETIKNMRFTSTEYNVSGVHTQSKPEDLFIIVDTFTSALIDVELLAEVFNMSKVEFQSRIIEVPYFKDPKRVALIVDRDKIQIWKNLSASDVIKNGAGLFNNIFKHEWDTIDSCGFANCVELRCEDLATTVPYHINATQFEVNNQNLNLTSTETPADPGFERKMPYDIIKEDAVDENGNVICELKETEMEIDTNGTVKNKVEKKVSKAKK